MAATHQSAEDLGTPSAIVCTNASGTATNLIAGAANRHARRVVNETDAATVTPNADITDLSTLTSVSQTTTIANLSGTPVTGQLWGIRIKSASVQTLAYGNKFRGSTDLALVTSTSGSALTDYFLFQYNFADSTWDFLAKNMGF